MEIPDIGMSVVSTIDITEPGIINDLRIQVNISHTHIGDLRVDLIAPDGTAVVLHNNTGGSANDLIKTYSVQEPPALRALLGQPIQGTWQLRVRDTFHLDSGRLNSWRIMARVAAMTLGPASAMPGSEEARTKGARKGARKEAGEKEPAGQYAQD